MKTTGFMELNAQELEEVNGGVAFLLAIPLAKVFAAGFAVGVTAGAIVLDRILQDK